MGNGKAEEQIGSGGPLSLADAVLQQAISDHAFPGAAFGVLLRGQMLATRGLGRFTYEQDARRVAPETIFDIASVSKVVATTAMAMRLWELGYLDLDKPISVWLLEFVDREFLGEISDSDLAARQHVTVRMLLTHSSGLPAYARLYAGFPTAHALFQACLRMPLEATPGTRAVYSDIGFILLGQLLERIAGEMLDVFCKREIFAPLRMTQTMYRPPEELRNSIPPTSADDVFRHRMIQGEVNDENCWQLGGISGHAGVFSNVPDLLRFADCILSGGAPIFQSETVQTFLSENATIPGSSRTLGWDITSQPSSSVRYFSPRSAGHLGYTGTSLWLDFEKQLAIVLLTNRTYPGTVSLGISKAIQQVRPAFHDAVVEALGLA